MVVMQLQKSNNVLKYYTIPNNLYLLSVKYLNNSWTLSVKKKKSLTKQIGGQNTLQPELHDIAGKKT